ncbi:hypothetical protein VTK73DRAFT_5826 [Phialemonium thermophilum]|uniref:Uncharacterized protein n=1 Tax=Phialemonium thermophilum TaxID=223376 RepID=A0ABR3V0J6_9PEZI
MGETEGQRDRFVNWASGQLRAGWLGLVSSGPAEGLEMGTGFVHGGKGGKFTKRGGRLRRKEVPALGRSSVAWSCELPPGAFVRRPTQNGPELQKKNY